MARELNRGVWGRQERGRLLIHGGRVNFDYLIHLEMSSALNCTNYFQMREVNNDKPRDEECITHNRYITYLS